MTDANLTEAAYQFVQFAKEALQRVGRKSSHSEIAQVLGTHYNQVGIAERRKGMTGYDLLVRWATTFRDAGLGDAVLTVDQHGPRFAFTFPDGSSPALPSPSGLPHEWIPAEASDHDVMTCGHCFIGKPKESHHILLRQECHIRLRERVTGLEAAIRKHRSAQGQDLCWLNDTELWKALGDGTVVDRQVPPWPEFMAGCVRYRQMLEQVPK